MSVPEMILAVVLVLGFVLVLAALLQLVRRGGSNMLLYPVRRSSKAMPEDHGKVRTLPRKR